MLPAQQHNKTPCPCLLPYLKLSQSLDMQHITGGPSNQAGPSGRAHLLLYVVIFTSNHRIHILCTAYITKTPYTQCCRHYELSTRLSSCIAVYLPTSDALSGLSAHSRCADSRSCECQCYCACMQKVPCSGVACQQTNALAAATVLGVHNSTYL